MKYNYLHKEILVLNINKLDNKSLGIDRNRYSGINKDSGEPRKLYRLKGYKPLLRRSENIRDYDLLKASGPASA